MTSELDEEARLEMESERRGEDESEKFYEDEAVSEELLAEAKAEEEFFRKQRKERAEIDALLPKKFVGLKCCGCRGTFTQTCEDCDCHIEAYYERRAEMAYDRSAS